MWQRVKNFFLSFRTYADLSPDVKTRRQVNRWLRDRPALTSDEWYEYFWQARQVSPAVATFAYIYLEQYSGLQTARILPSDRLEEDLHLTLVCWFDWHFTLCEDFEQHLGVGIEDYLEMQDLSTVEEFVMFLNQQLLSVNHS
ncbi:hypothetical protein NDA01_23735 [Trichocoleus desertorum AS-A10]|uniref:hypothetical protein n=1 Tax=Trichocoleus desertorum TaxID=1481672 RepID=UPI0032997B47